MSGGRDGWFQKAPERVNSAQAIAHAVRGDFGCGIVWLRSIGGAVETSGAVCMEPLRSPDDMLNEESAADHQRFLAFFERYLNRADGRRLLAQGRPPGRGGVGLSRAGRGPHRLTLRQERTSGR